MMESNRYIVLKPNSNLLHEILAEFSQSSIFVLADELNADIE